MRVPWQLSDNSCTSCFVLHKFFYATKAVGAFFYDLSLTKTNLRAGWGGGA